MAIFAFSPGCFAGPETPQVPKDRFKELFQDINKTGKVSPEMKTYLDQLGAHESGKGVPQEGVFLGGVDLNKGRELFAQNKLAEAEAKFQKVLSLRQQKYGSADALLIEPLLALAMVAERRNQWSAAQQYYQQASNIGRTAMSTGKNSDPRDPWDHIIATVVQALNGQAKAALMTNSYKECESACKEAMSIEDSGRSKMAAMQKGITVQTYAELFRRTGYLEKALQVQQGYRQQLKQKMQQLQSQAVAPPH
jgi:tetratricopeptide (TPR) repeat protein